MTPAKLAQVSAARVPVSPAAFLDQMAADVGHQHVKRLGELRHLLQDEVRGSSAAVVQPSVEQLARSLPQLDFRQLEPRGWWASLTGKGRSADSAFAAAVEGIEEAAKALAGGVAAAQKAQQPHAVAAERVLVECEVEVQALDKIIDQGARWLQAMRNDLKQREQQAGDDAQARAQLAEDDSRCEILVERLKALRAVATASQQAHQQALATAERRSAVTLAIQQALVAEVAAWRSRMAKLVGGAVEGRTAGALDRGRDAHEQLQRRLAGVLADCDQLRTLEAALDDSLAEMGERVAAVA
jgi:chromosome segregation ATPase